MMIASMKFASIKGWQNVLVENKISGKEKISIESFNVLNYMDFTSLK